MSISFQNLAQRIEGPRPPGSAANRPRHLADRVLVGLVLVAVLVSQVVAFALGLWHPEINDRLPEFIETHREAWWAWHTYSGLVFVATAGSYAAIMWWLVPGRGRTLAVWGGILMGVGVASFGAGLVAEAATHWYTHSPVLSEAQSHDLLVYVTKHETRLALPISIGLVLTVAGPILSSIGLWISGVLRRWVVVLFAIGTIVGTVFGPVTILSVLAYAAMCVVIWEADGATDRRASTSASISEMADPSST